MSDFDPPAFATPAFPPPTLAPFDPPAIDNPEIDALASDAFDIDTDRMIAFTQDLVRIPTVFDPDRGFNEEPAAKLVADLMRSFGWSPQIDIVAPGRPNVWAVVDGGRPGPTLMFEGHTDVVTEGDPAAWTVDPFGGDISDGKLWGRGAADMKGGLAAMLFAADVVRRRGPFPGRIVLAALVDEEGMMTGAKDFVTRGHAQGVDAVICCEPEGGEICHVAKGALRLRLDFHGKMAHGAMPFEGKNPNRAAAAAIAALSILEREVQVRHGAHPHLGEVWITPTVLHAGEPAQMNVMPATASAWIDVRSVPATPHNTLMADISRVVTAAAGEHGVTVKLSVIDDRPSVATPEEHRLVRAVWDAHAAVTGDEPRLGGVPGSTDGTVLTSRTGMASVVYGPGGKWIAHQADEYVEIDDVVTHARVYADAAFRFLDDSMWGDSTWADSTWTDSTERDADRSG